ncbi:hypothetical protein L3Q82_004145 [Scortum barcoo]|uniref:Uncharacterized protein n=1 Tax=Scortum barcoo TaxID=214431 RepID=A0ACB8X7L0_9TELE|nr:hypothetical protein L3Q82_004145 [Scortum barcoo]
MNRTPVTKGNPAGVQHALGTGLTYCLTMRTKLLLGRTETRTALSKGSRTPYSWSTPTEYHEGHGRMPSPDPQSTCGLVGQTPINPQAPCGGIELVQCSTTRTKNRIVPPESEGRLSAEFSLQYPGVDLRGGWKCDPL